MELTLHNYMEKEKKMSTNKHMEEVQSEDYWKKCKDNYNDRNWIRRRQTGTNQIERWEEEEEDENLKENLYVLRSATDIRNTYKKRNNFF